MSAAVINAFDAGKIKDVAIRRGWTRSEESEKFDI